jgi:hypothetical protein
MGNSENNHINISTEDIENKINNLSNLSDNLINKNLIPGKKKTKKRLKIL